MVPDKFGNIHVDTGTPVKLPCHVTPSTTTNVTWLQLRERPTSWRIHNIYINGQLHVRLRDDQIATIQNPAVGDYSLTFWYIQPVNAGRYQCFNQQQLLKNYVIYVDGWFNVLTCTLFQSFCSAA